ncbi:MAG: cupin domain-containing protein [Pseudomonadota bacterium]
MPDTPAHRTLLDGAWRNGPFEPFREGVEVCWLHRPAAESYPQVALLRYQPGASVPRHAHEGLETILVLEGAQSDERGRYPAGTFVTNPAGSVHSVWSDEGCVVLIQWSAPIRILE